LTEQEQLVREANQKIADILKGNWTAEKVEQAGIWLRDDKRINIAQYNMCEELVNYERKQDMECTYYLIYNSFCFI
jgi:hypothetical protein